MVLPDHSTPIAVRTHVHDPVPFAIYDSRHPTGSATGMGFDEESAGKDGLAIEHGHEIMDIFMRGE
jgi:2,3-bisphosphoglycerate-independent phosphoglycerate mutase